MRACHGDRTLARTLAQSLAIELLGQLATLRGAVAAHDPDAVGRAAVALEATAGALGADAAVAAAQLVQERAAGDVGGWCEAPTLLDRTVDRLARRWGAIGCGVGVGASGYPKSARPARILLVDDNATNRDLASFLLERAGHSVAVATGGLEALDCLERERFDLVLMDVQMPDLDGLATVRTLREREGRTGGHVAVVGLTPVDSRQRCLAAGMDGFIQQPLGNRDFFRAIETVLQICA
jgi:CheY-like chemotaxis protein